MRRVTNTLLSTAVVALLAACGTGSEPSSTPATTGTPTSREPTSDAPTTDLPGSDPTAGGQTFPESTAAQSAENSGQWDLVLVGVRVGEHEGFDRIVLEFTGTGVPGWTAGYVDEAVLDGSGRVLSLGGDAILDVYATGTTYPGPRQDHYDGPRQFEPENGGDVNDVHVGGTFEGYTQVLAGIDGGAVPFRVFALTDPARLVVDVVD